MGLWGLGFGNGASAGPANALYFAAAFVTNGAFHGLFGTLTAVAGYDNERDNDGDEEAENDDQEGGRHEREQ